MKKKLHLLIGTKFMSILAQTENSMKGNQLDNLFNKKYKFQFQMRARHSIEIKNMREQSSRKKKFQDPDSDSNLTTESSNHSHTLKSSGSSCSLHTSQSEISLISQRYKTLKDDYNILLDQTQSKVSLFKKQKDQLHKYRTLHVKNQKEIERLKSLLNIAKKSEFGPTTVLTTEFLDSKIAKCQKNSSSVPKERKTPITYGKPPLMNRESISSKEGTGLRKMANRGEKGQFGRYKFVPSVLE